MSCGSLFHILKVHGKNIAKYCDLSVPHRLIYYIPQSLALANN